MLRIVQSFGSIIVHYVRELCSNYRSDDLSQLKVLVNSLLAEIYKIIGEAADYDDAKNMLNSILVKNFKRKARTVSLQILAENLKEFMQD